MKRFCLVCLLIVFLFTPQTTRANENFQISQNLHYQVQESGRLTVTQKISLTNKLADIYATQYSLSLQEVKIANVRAHDDGGVIQPEVNRADRVTTIKLNFNQPVVGKGKTLNFTLQYEAANLVQKNGQIWEINIPKLSAENQPDHYQMSLAVPQSFGRLAMLRPQPLNQETKDGLRLYYFSKEQMTASGINANFGEFQIFDFILTYHLDNPTNSKINTEIALPPDTAFQQVLYQQLRPLPLAVRLDSDGNWLAQYQLKAHEKININALGQARVFSQPQKNFWLPDPEAIKNNLSPQPAWPADHPLIQSKARELKTSRAIYSFVVNHLRYNLSRVHDDAQRLGALEALQNPDQAICTEFTDLFIALCRAAGIPAREINGFAYTTNPELQPLNMVSDILHAWPEYWDEAGKVWVPVDPTWGKTTGGIDYFSKTDMNHFAFAIHGQEDGFPYPAGSYKASEAPSKDVQIVFGQKLIEADSQVTVHFDLPHAITVENTGRNALYHLTPQIQSETLNITSPNKNITALLPFGKQKVDLEIKSLAALNFQSNLVTVTINGQQFSQMVNLYSFPWQMAVAGAALIIIVVTILTRPWNYVRKKARS